MTGSGIATTDEQHQRALARISGLEDLGVSDLEVARWARVAKAANIKVE